MLFIAPTIWLHHASFGSPCRALLDLLDAGFDGIRVIHFPFSSNLFSEFFKVDGAGIVLWNVLTAPRVLCPAERTPVAIMFVFFTPQMLHSSCEQMFLEYHRSCNRSRPDVEKEGSLPAGLLKFNLSQRVKFDSEQYRARRKDRMLPVVRNPGGKTATTLHLPLSWASHPSHVINQAMLPLVLIADHAREPVVPEGDLPQNEAAKPYRSGLATAGTLFALVQCIRLSGSFDNVAFRSFQELINGRLCMVSNLSVSHAAVQEGSPQAGGRGHSPDKPNVDLRFQI